ncbi:MAG: DNA polymerase III subunit gamma/tau [Elusimicrobia bacterium]|nr:DNA polymerase III subunit gamma/tau [Elusimicrobiota bacterium]
MALEKTPYVGLARKHRPQRFEEIIGQEAVSTTLRNALEEKKTSHAYLFFGPRGVGKTTTARVLAKALNCRSGPAPSPCGTCDCCREIARSSAIDVLELDAATHTQVDRIREMIIETVSLSPSRDRFKVFIIDEVHMLSIASFNALLKTLEEPPAHVVFILATTDAGKLPATIVSRCQRFRFRPLPAETLAEHLKQVCKAEGIRAEPQALQLLARAAGGSVRDAVSLLEQAHAYAEDALSAAKARELLGALPEELLLDTSRAILAKDAAALAAALGRVFDEGADAAQLLRGLRERFHEAHLYRLGVAQVPDADWKSCAEGASAQTFAYLVQRSQKLLESLRFSDSPRLTLEAGLYGLLEEAHDLSDWVRRLEALERRLASRSPDPVVEEPGAGEPQPAASGEEVASPAGGQAAPDDAPPPAPAHLERAAESVWFSVLREVERDKPMLAQELRQGTLACGEENQWRVLFRRSFSAERAKNHQKFLEDKIREAVGRPVRLDFAVGPVGERASGEPSAGDEPEPRWKDPEQAPVEDPDVKKVLDVFPGRVRRIKKK